MQDSLQQTLPANVEVLYGILHHSTSLLLNMAPWWEGPFGSRSNRFVTSDSEKFKFTGTEGNDFPAPPEGVEFRLVGWRSKKVIFSRNASPEVGISDPEPVNPDQIFTLIHGTGDKKGLYAIKSVNTGKVLFSRGDNYPPVGHVDGDGAYTDK